jgi:hypothetical protein
MPLCVGVKIVCEDMGIVWLTSLPLATISGVAGLAAGEPVDRMAASANATISKGIEKILVHGRASGRELGEAAIVPQ